MILAGGSGTRFWPRSRRARAKQVLALEGERTMIQDTLARMKPVAGASDVWVITNGWLQEVIAEQLAGNCGEHVLAEPVARNTAPACALAAFLLEKTEPETVMGVFPSDHVVANPKRFAEVIAAGVRLAAAGENIVVLGVKPTRAETGYGYIEQGALVGTRRECREGTCSDQCASCEAVSARSRTRRRRSGFWRRGILSGMPASFLWSVKTLCECDPRA